MLKQCRIWPFHAIRTRMVNITSFSSFVIFLMGLFSCSFCGTLPAIFILSNVPEHCFTQRDHYTSASPNPNSASAPTAAQDPDASSNPAPRSNAAADDAANPPAAPAAPGPRSSAHSEDLLLGLF